MNLESINTSVYQPTVSLERLPSTVYNECIINGYVKVKQDKASKNVPQLNSHAVGVSPTILEKIKNIVVKTCPNYQDAKIKIILVPPGNLINKFLTNPQASGVVAEEIKNGLLNNTQVNIQRNKRGRKPILKPGQIIRYGVEDLKRDDMRRKKEMEEKKWKPKLLRKILDKYYEKEMKKNVLYKQKILTKYVLKHQIDLHQHIDFLTSARKHVKSAEVVNTTLKQLEIIKNAKIKKHVCKFFKDLVEAVKNVPEVPKKTVASNQNLLSEKVIVEEIVKDPVKFPDKHLLLKQNFFIKKSVKPKIQFPHNQSSLLKQKSANRNPDKLKQKLRRTQSLLSKQKMAKKKTVQPKQSPGYQSLLLNQQVISDNSNELILNSPCNQSLVLNKKMAESDDDIQNWNPTQQEFLLEQHLLSEQLSQWTQQLQEKLSDESEMQFNDSSSETEFEMLIPNSPKYENDKLASFVGDQFTDSALITGDKQLLECFCGKPNCIDLHPENFYM